VIGADDFDLHAMGRWVEVLRRQIGSCYRTWSGGIRVKTGHIGKHADLDDAVGELGLRGGAD
jgi:hypothetical protein